MFGMIEKLQCLDGRGFCTDINKFSLLKDRENNDHNLQDGGLVIEPDTNSQHVRNSSCYSDRNQQDGPLAIECDTKLQDLRNSYCPGGIPLFVEIPLCGIGNPDSSNVFRKTEPEIGMEGLASDNRNSTSLLQTSLPRVASDASHEDNGHVLSLESFKFNKKRKNHILTAGHATDNSFYHNGTLASDLETSQNSIFDSVALETRSKETFLNENTYAFKKTMVKDSAASSLSHCRMLSQKDSLQFGNAVPDHSLYSENNGPNQQHKAKKTKRHNNNKVLNYNFQTVDIGNGKCHLKEELCNNFSYADVPITKMASGLKIYNESPNDHLSARVANRSSSMKTNDEWWLDNQAAAGFISFSVLHGLEYDTGKENNLYSRHAFGLHPNLINNSSLMKKPKVDARKTPDGKQKRNEDMKRDFATDSCIAMLNKYMFVDLSVANNPAAEHPGVVGDGKVGQKCKLCGKLEDRTSTLICDLCEEPFHLSCCISNVRHEPLQDYWYCAICKKNVKNRDISEKSELQKDDRWKIFHIKSVERKLDLFCRMLQGCDDYTTQVRIGEAYQADIPDRSDEATIVEESSRMGKTISMEERTTEAEIANENLKKVPYSWKPANPLCNDFRENWLQCKKILYYEGEICPDGRKAKKDIICNKWRRAPLSEIQNDEWECSCAVVWDPVHADCAVPQELSTDDIIRRTRVRDTNNCLELAISKLDK